MIEDADRCQMLAVPLCGDRVLMRLESIGVRRLRDLKGRDPWELMHEINLEAGKTIWRAPSRCRRCRTSSISPSGRDRVLPLF